MDWRRVLEALRGDALHQSRVEAKIAESEFLRGRLWLLSLGALLLLRRGVVGLGMLSLHCGSGSDGGGGSSVVDATM